VTIDFSNPCAAPAGLGNDSAGLAKKQKRWRARATIEVAATCEGLETVACEGLETVAYEEPMMMR